MTSLLLFFGGFVTGILALIGYGCYRGVNSDGWDDSNMLNWIRLFSHIVMHPEDFTRMYYVDDTTRQLVDLEMTERRYGLDTLTLRYSIITPFPYLNKDEFSENFPGSRP